MDQIENNNRHHVERAWDHAIGQIRAAMSAPTPNAAAVVILLPFAQLVPVAREAWLRGCASGGVQSCFLPQFETAMSWTRALGGWAPAADDLRLDRARDLLTASSLLARAGLVDYQELLAAPLVDAAWSLSAVAAAVPPGDRAQWGKLLGEALAAGMDSPMLALEAATARLALAWAASSSYASDRLFEASPALLVLVQGFQSEPMTLSLESRLGASTLVVPLYPGCGQQPPTCALHAAGDGEDEALRAAACVLRHLVAGRTPVALVAQDRLLTRRVHAMLEQHGVRVHDETGWKLSTTRAAASLMSLLRAVVWNASTDDLLDWLKNAPAFEATAVTELEETWRSMGLRDWRAVCVDAELVRQVKALRQSMQNARTLTRWLAALRAALQCCGLWRGMQYDAAGQAVLGTLRLRDGAELEFFDHPTRMSQADFVAWVDHTLEGANFLPPYPSGAQVVVLPLSQMLGRAPAAVVLPGCDEFHLAVSPQPPGRWSAAQRSLLGLPSREQLAASLRASWRYALQFPNVDVLWRTSDRGEQVLPSGFVQELLLQHDTAQAPEPYVLRALTALPGVMPAPRSAALPLSRLSSSAYEDLRRCPYRFFALRQLHLKESDELDTEPDKRDFGNWIHHLLKQFHEDLGQAPTTDQQARSVMLNVAAEHARTALGLSDSDFLPFAAVWPNLRAGYLRWLADHEARGAVFSEAEAWREVALGQLTLVGKLDRIDRLADGTALVIDYKTEAPASTSQRLKRPLEDTQLAFYAALLDDDTLGAAYVNLGEDETTRSYVQADIVVLRDKLIEGIVSDMARVAQGAPMAALGEGKACEYCAARGLCRKDFWEVS